MLLTSALLVAQFAPVHFKVFQLNQRSPEPSSFSQHAVEIWQNLHVEGKPVRSIEIPSPDGKKSVTAIYDKQNDLTVLTVSANLKRFRVNIGQGLGAELAWSSDSQAFFLMFSDAGLVGEYHTRIFYVSESGLRKVNPDFAVKKAFGHSGACSSNVVGVGWLEGSHRILVAAQVPPLTTCDSYGTFELFELSLPNASIINSYGQLFAKKRFWSYLGEDLRNARDNCITDPKSCFSTDRRPGTN